MVRRPARIVSGRRTRKPTDPIVKRLDVLEQTLTRLSAGSIPYVVHQHLLQRSKINSHRRVVPTIPLPVPRSGEGLIMQQTAAMLAGLLHPPIHMCRQSLSGKSLLNPHLERIDHEPSLHPFRHRHPIILHEYKSSTAARYSSTSLIRKEVTSALYSSFFREGVK